MNRIIHYPHDDETSIKYNITTQNNMKNHWALHVQQVLPNSISVLWGIIAQIAEQLFEFES